MRTFAQKPKTALQAVPARARPGKSREVSSILHGNQTVQRAPAQNDDKKAELEFRGRFAFITESGSSSTGPSSKAGYTAIEARWTVQNSGWETAPEHIDRLTIYKADGCSGCRDKKDEVLSMNVIAPATAPMNQPGGGEFRYEAVTGMFVMNLKAGHYEAYVDLDVHDEVDEINKDNNTLFTSWYAAPSPEPEDE